MTPDEIQRMRQGAQMLSILSQLYGSRMSKLLEPHGLTPAQFGVLNHIARPDLAEGTRISDIAKAVELNQPAITKTIAKFEAMSLATLTPSPDDQRAKRVMITPQGQEALITIQKSLAPGLAGLFAELSPEEFGSFAKSAGKLISWLDQNRL